MKAKLRRFERLETREYLTVSPEFLADIRPGELGSKIGLEWIAYQDEIYFAADNGANGRELWKTNGTEAGTQMVKDIAGGEGDGAPVFFAIYQDLLYFRADDGDSGFEIWRSNGTSGGTQRFVDLNPGPDDSQPGNFWVFNDLLYFRANDGELGSELYRTDGSVAGTDLVRDIHAGLRGSEPGADSGFIPFQGSLYFSADGAVGGEAIGTELYRTDGQTTELVLDADHGSDSSLPTQFTIFQNDLYFIAEVPLPPLGVDYAAYLYRVDGDTGQVERFFSEPVDFSESLTIIGDTMYFAGGGEATGIELYRTDGTQAGTVLVHDAFPGEDSSKPQNFFALGERLFFSAGDRFEPGTNRVVQQLWVTEGTSATTRKLSTDVVNPQTPLVAYRDEVFYLGNDGQAGWELFKSDGTVAGTGMVRDIRPGAGDAFAIPKLVFEDELLFLADDGSHGMEIWTWDGSVAELAEVHLGGGGFTTQPEQFRFIPYGKDLLFSGSTPFEGDELFVIRGTAAEPVPGDADGNGTVDFADFLILSAHFGTENASRAEGDFDGDGRVQFADFLILSAHFGHGTE